MLYSFLRTLEMTHNPPHLGKLRLEDTKLPARGHKANKWLSWDADQLVQIQSSGAQPPGPYKI